MNTYTLRYQNDGRGLNKKVQFEAENAGLALEVANAERAERDAELWRDDQRLCTIRRSDNDVWRIVG